MLPPHIIDELRKRERYQKEQFQREQPRVDLPLPEPLSHTPPPEDANRGVTIIPLF